MFSPESNIAARVSVPLEQQAGYYDYGKIGYCFQPDSWVIAAQQRMLLAKQG
jgi:hypothetical protein